MKATGLIILDGPDGAGKTTLAQYYVKQYGAIYMHLTYRFKDNMFNYHTAMLLKACKLVDQGHLVIIDRLWMSELVYAKVFRGGSRWPFMSRFLDRIILKYSGIYVMCIPESSREYLTHYDELKTLRDEMYESMFNVHYEYERLWQKIQDERWPHAFRYDLFVDGLDLEGYAENALNNLQEQQADNPIFSDEPSPIQNNIRFSGSLAHGEVAFIDASPTTRKEKPWFPRHVYGHGSLHLSGILEIAGIPEYKLMWMDAQDEVTWKHLLGNYDIKPICLGHEAYRKIVHDTKHFTYYGQPDCHITPERDLESNGQTTFMQRLILQLQIKLGFVK